VKNRENLEALSVDPSPITPFSAAGTFHLKFHSKYTLLVWLVLLKSHQLSWSDQLIRCCLTCFLCRPQGPSFALLPALSRT